MMNGWNLADVFETVAAVQDTAVAQIQGERMTSWRQFDRHANALAENFLDAGLKHQSKVAVMLYNCPEFMETYVAAFKAALVPVNTNYRYGAGELLHLWTNADAEVIVFHACFAQLIDSIRSRLPLVKRWYVVADGSPMPDWAIPHEDVVSAGAARPTMPWHRSGDDLLFLYTGGTTGMPKGVMWRQDDLFQVLNGGSDRVRNLPSVTTHDKLAERLRAEKASPCIPACPLMHGTGQFGAFVAMWTGRAILCLESRRFDAAQLWNTVDAHRAGTISIVGDAFARPMLEHLDEAPGRHDLDCVESITSSGTIWSRKVKDGLLRHIPGARLFDAFGSSEAIGLGLSLATADDSVSTARFIPGENLRVIGEDDRPVTPGSGEVGMVALSGLLPMGYYKDTEKTAHTFRTIDGIRYSLPGDFACIEKDGSLTLLGRGSVCINTGGEKVFPEEVEEVLKLHPDVVDALCVGVPDKRFGQAICAIVEPVKGNRAPTLETLSALAREHLAAYKAPRHLLVVESLARAPNGKADYRHHTWQAREHLRL